MANITNDEYRRYLASYLLQNLPDDYSYEDLYELITQFEEKLL